MAVATGQITIVDLNDAVNLQGYLQTTRPKVQFLNGSTYTPDWTSNGNNVVEAQLFKTGSGDNIVQSTDIQSISWYYQLTGGNRTAIVEDSNFTLVSGINSKVYKISIDKNIMNSSNGGLTIFCDIVYNAGTYTVPVSLTLDFTLSVKGDTGATGASAKTVSLTTTSQILTSSPTGGDTNPTTSTITGSAVNTTISAWTYSINGGTFTATLPAGVERSGNTVTITGSSMTAKTITVKAADANGIADTLTIAKTVDGADGDDAYTVVLGNESHTFIADESGLVTATTVVINIYGYIGSVLSPVTLGAATGLPTGMTAPIANSGTTTAKYTITIASNSILGGSNSGVVTLPITIGGKVFNRTFSWAKSFAGSSSVILSVWSVENGTVFKNATDTEYIKLQADLYKGGEIVASPTSYTWYYQDPSGSDDGAGWKAITSLAGMYALESSNKILKVYSAAVPSLETYRCKVVYGGKEYRNTISLVDQTDPFQVRISSTNGDIFKNTVGETTLKVFLYRNGTEIDINGTDYVYDWSQHDKEGNLEAEAFFTPTSIGTQLAATATKASSGTNITLSAPSAAIIAGKYYVFGSELFARKVATVNGTAVSLAIATTKTFPAGTTIKPVTDNMKSIKVSALDIDEKSTYFVDVLA